MRKFAVLVAAMALTTLVAVTASAVPYTLAGQVNWATGGASGTLDPISAGDFAALTNQVCGAGACPIDASGATVDVVYFTLTVNVGAVDELGVTNLSTPIFTSPNVDAAGFFDDNTGLDPGPVEIVGNGALWRNGDPAGENWNFSGTTEILFVAHNLGELPTTDGINFMIEADASTAIDNFPGVLVAIPEPTIALLLGLGALGIARAARRS